jgi:hypothetical protein
MRLTVVSLLLVLVSLSAFATPVITDIQPPEGFSFGPTHVTIFGSGFADGAVEVFFDSARATVLEGTPTMLRVVALPDQNLPLPRFATVTVRVAGHGEIVRPEAFYFSADAQPGPEDYMPVIVPLTAGSTPGAHGSSWTSALHIFNSAYVPLRLPGPEAFILDPPIDPAVIIPARSTEQVFVNRREPGVDGAFLYVPLPLSYAPKMSLRVRDTSQNAASLGTEVPVVRRDEASSGITLIDIPIDPRYRATLRIYGFTAAPMQVGVRILPEDGDTPIEQFDVELQGIINAVFEPFPAHPAYLALDPLTPAVRASGGRVRIELTNYGDNVSPPPPAIWAFVSITNNETQQVTVISPK